MTLHSAAPSGVPAHSPPPPVTVLIADAHPVVRHGLRGLLADCPDLNVVGDGPCEVGPAVRAAATATAAVAVVGGPAAAAVAAAAGLWEGVGCRVLVLSACEDPAEVRRAMSAGAGGYVLLRSPADELVRAVRAVAAGDTYLDPAVAHAVAGVPAPADGLSEREVQTLRLIARGYSNKEIGGRMGVSVKSIETYKSRALKKLGVKSRVELVRYAIRQGWLADDSPTGDTSRQHAE
jgi:DNA-binding NarL/FixJ family response regulator